MKRRLVACFAALTLGTMMFAGCASNTASENEGNEPNATSVASSQTKSDTGTADQTRKGIKISIVGSTTITEPMEKLVEAYKESGCPDKIEVQGNGSSAGIRAVADGTADIGMSSRELSEDEKKLGLTETIIAHDGIAVVVNTTNPVSNLTKEQIKDIYEGRITNWNEVGGKDAIIIPVTREAGSGTRGAFEELFELLTRDKASTIIDRALVGEGTGSIMATVASKENAIGYISLGYMSETVRPVAIDGVEPSSETVLAGEYTISRPLLLLTSDSISKEAKAFLEYILGEEGQSVISERYIPVNK